MKQKTNYSPSAFARGFTVRPVAVLKAVIILLISTKVSPPSDGTAMVMSFSVL